MKIIEEFISSKYKDGTRCEDGIYVSEHFVVLIDGVTAKGHKLWEGRKSGEHAKNIIIKALPTLSHKLSKTEIFDALNNALLAEASLDTIGKNNLLKASIVIYSAYHSQIWSYGDCQVMINNELITKSKSVDTLLANIRSDVLKFYHSDKSIEQIFSEDHGRAFIQPLLEQQYKFENVNRTYGYAVLNGTPINDSMINVFNVRAGDHVIFASDGYPEVFVNLQKSEAYLKEMLNRDPNCFVINKQTKGLNRELNSYDDRSYISFVILDN